MGMPNVYVLMCDEGGSTTRFLQEEASPLATTTSICNINHTSNDWGTLIA